MGVAGVTLEERCAMTCSLQRKMSVPSLAVKIADLVKFGVSVDKDACENLEKRKISVRIHRKMTKRTRRTRTEKRKMTKRTRMERRKTRTGTERRKMRTALDKKDKKDKDGKKKDDKKDKDGKKKDKDRDGKKKDEDRVGQFYFNGEEYCERHDMIRNEERCRESSCCHWNDYEEGEASFNGQGRCWSDIGTDTCIDMHVVNGEEYCERHDMLRNEERCRASSCCQWNDWEEGDASFNGQG